MEFGVCSDWSVFMTMRQGKQNQHGKIEYMGCMRKIDPVLCPLSFYFFNRWGKDGAQPFRRPGSRRTTTATTSSPAASGCRNGL